MLLEDCLKEAVGICTNRNEEEGGVIIHHPPSGEFKFHHFRNENSGTPRALTLYIADRTAFASTVFPKFKEGWRLFASFHTHPQFPPGASNTDITYLFKGFRRNFIYSPPYGVVRDYNTDEKGITDLRNFTDTPV